MCKPTSRPWRSFTDIPAYSATDAFPEWTNKDEEFHLPFRVFVQKNDGTEYTAEAALTFTSIGNAVRVGYGAILLTRHTLDRAAEIIGAAQFPVHPVPEGCIFHPVVFSPRLRLDPPQLAY